MTLHSLLDTQPVQGISGYKEITNTHFLPAFRVMLPENWQFSFIPSPNAKGFWIAIRGPLDEAAQQYTSIHITSEEDLQPNKSLDELAKQSILGKSYGESSTLYCRPSLASSIEAREILLKCHKIISSSMVEKAIPFMVQWTLLRVNLRIIQITFSSSENNYKELLPAYVKAVETFTLQK